MMRDTSPSGKTGTSAEGPLWLRPAEAAAYLGLSVQTLAQYRTRGDGPPFRSPADASRVIRYARADLDAWLGAQRRRALTTPDGHDGTRGAA